jgi:transposase InsO family protein
MEQEIRLIVNKCKLCQQRKTGNQMVQPPKNKTTTTFPFEKLAIDITGPLPVTKSGHRYILGVIDYFSKFIMLIPLRNTDSMTVAEAIFKKWICLFGAPNSIHSDRGTCFESALFLDLCKLCGIRKTRTAPYYPQSDGLIERLFRTVKDMLFATMRTFNKDWKEAIPFVEMGIRSSVQSTIKVSPFEVLFGKMMRLPTIWMYPTNQKLNELLENRSHYSEYVMQLQTRLSKIHANILQVEQHRENSSSSMKKQGVSIQIGSYVMAKRFPVEKCINNARYDGPYLVSNKLGEWTYQLVHVKTGERVVRNHHHVKRCSPELSSTKCRSELNTIPVDKQQPKQKRHKAAPDRYGFSARREV